MSSGKTACVICRVYANDVYNSSSDLLFFHFCRTMNITAWSFSSKLMMVYPLQGCFDAAYGLMLM